MTDTEDNLSDSEVSAKTLLQDDDINREGEELIFNPYNNENKEITLNEVQSILTSYGVPGKVFNINLYKRAFIHKSYTKRPILENIRENITIEEKPDDCLPLKTKSNERLEFLVMAFGMYYKILSLSSLPKENEGFMTEKNCSCENESIGRLAYEMGLHKWYIISKYAEEKKIRTTKKTRLFV